MRSKWAPWQCHSSPVVCLLGAHIWQLGTPSKKPAYWATWHCLTTASVARTNRLQSRRFPPPLTIKVWTTKRRAFLIGMFSQFLLMPPVMFGLSHAFGLPSRVAIGVVLMGSAPGGSTSNLLTSWTFGNVALSVAMSESRLDPNPNPYPNPSTPTQPYL